MEPQLIGLDFIPAEGGGITKVIDKYSSIFSGFGELYISEIQYGAFRGWKLHKEMSALLFVISGTISVHVTTNDSECKSIEVSQIDESRQALLLPAGNVFGFKSVSKKSSIANFANIEHQESEIIRYSTNHHECSWLP